MTRPIDAESLWKAISNVGFPALNRSGYIDRQCVYELIKKAPTVPQLDFKEGYKQAIRDGKTNFSRPKGKWKEWINEKWGGISIYCQNCGETAFEKSIDGVYRQVKSNYCPNCGAEMKGADDENCKYG